MTITIDPSFFEYTKTRAEWMAVEGRRQAPPPPGGGSLVAAPLRRDPWLWRVLDAAYELGRYTISDFRRIAATTSQDPIRAMRRDVGVAMYQGDDDLGWIDVAAFFDVSVFSAQNWSRRCDPDRVVELMALAESYD